MAVIIWAKTLLRATEIFTECRGNVIRRAGDEREDRLFDCDAAACANTQLGRRLLGGMGEKGTLLLSEILPASRASKTMYSVIILVSDAG